MFETLPFNLVFTRRLATLQLAFVLLVLFVFELMLARAISMTTSPMAITPTMTAPPIIHQIALDFFRGIRPGTAADDGAHCGGCDAGMGGCETGGCETCADGLLAGGGTDG